MECKDGSNRRPCSGILIGIYPEWNVKQFAPCAIYDLIRIGIYPEWNVKDDDINAGKFIIIYWNISRMECKVAT